MEWVRVGEELLVGDEVEPAEALTVERRAPHGQEPRPLGRDRRIVDGLVEEAHLVAPDPEWERELVGRDRHPLRRRDASVPVALVARARPGETARRLARREVLAPVHHQERRDDPRALLPPRHRGVAEARTGA